MIPIQELDGWYILCGEAIQQYSVLESKCVKTQLNQTLNIEKLTGDYKSANPDSGNGGRLSKNPFNAVPHTSLLAIAVLNHFKEIEKFLKKKSVVNL